MFKKYIYYAILKVMGKSYNSQYLKIKNLYDEDVEEKLSRFQEKYLTDLLLHAYKNVPYYHRVFKDAGVVHDGAVELSNFGNIPILTKEIIRNENLTSKDYTSRKWFYNYSGGSTGEPTSYIQDIHYRKWIHATKEYYHQDMLGIDEINVREVRLWGSPRDVFKGSIGLRAKIGNWVANRVILNSFKMSKKDMENHIKILNSYKPDLILGYAGALHELCIFVEEANFSIHTPKILVSSAETLGGNMREKIETVFGTKLYDFYGSRETASLAGECKYGLMHIFMFNNYMEILDDNNQPVKEGEMGKVIVTNLHNYSMPFIRYEIGDTAVLGPKKCKCGDILPTLKKVVGRIEEQFVLEDGGIVIGYFFVHLMGVVRNKGLIKKFQVIQEDYKKIKILVVPEGKISESEKKDIEDKIKVVMGKDCEIIWDFVDEIPETKSGKFLYTKSLVSR